MGDTSISWTNKTWNPIRGCSRVSEGCVNCYAERVATRFSGKGAAYEGLIKEWVPLVANWPELEALYVEELPNRTAPKLYARMAALRGERAARITATPNRTP